MTDTEHLHCRWCGMAYIFGRGSFHCHGDQILSSEQHQAQYPLLFTLRLFRILGPVKKGGEYGLNQNIFFTFKSRKVHRFNKTHFKSLFIQ